MGLFFRPRFRESALGSILLVAAVYLATLALTGHRGFWIMDNASKFLQLQAIVGSSYADYSIPWSGAALDPELHFNPLPAPFSHVAGGKIYSQYPPFFSLVSSGPYLLLGFHGLYLLPLLGALAVLAGVWRLAGTVGIDPPGRHLAVLFVGLCTPLWFYAVVFWEHSLAVALGVWAVDRYLRFAVDRSLSRLVLGGLSAAAAVWFRDDALLFCGVLAVFAVVCARGIRLRAAAVATTTMLAAIAPLLVFQWRVLGEPLGYHVTNNVDGLAEHLTARADVVYNLFFGAHESAVISTVVALPFVAAFVWNPRLDSSRFCRALAPAAGVASIAAAVFLNGFLVATDKVTHLLASNGLFLAAPVILLGLVRPRGARGDEAATRLWRLILGFGAIYALAAPEISSGGIHWGNRFLLLLYPLLGVLAARNVAFWFAKRDGARRGQLVAIASAVLLSLAVQLYSLYLLDTKRELTERANRELAARPEPVIATDVWWAPQELYASFYEKPVFFVSTPERLETLKGRLRAAGYDEMLLATQDENPTIDDADLRFFSLILTNHRLD